MVTKPCKDCLAEGLATGRPAPYPGPRCATHWRVEKRRRKAAAHSAHVVRNFELTPDEYQAIYEAQGGVCYICQKAKGLSRALAVDHDHQCTAGHPPEHGCHLCVRALLCSRCNRLIGFLDVAALKRAIEVLLYRPAQAVLARYHASKEE